MITVRRRVLLGILCGTFSSIAAWSKSYAADKFMKTEDSNQYSDIHFVGGGNMTPWLHFDMPDLRRIMLVGKINDAPAQFLLDSGVGARVLDTDFASALKLRTVDRVTGVGVTGHVN